ncbi:unnamed protein product [Mytilus edulis]|uniref:Heat shock 70 kDa protein 12A n=1 Tax=Mytilus edulis TaxID=6550 RepID=A0A8S3R160_MYTED|nr:unnamed protein product [Mytilus edulis]
MACGETISESLLVAAIDFGTTFSGYGYISRGDYKDDPTMVYGRIWHSNSQPGLSLKTPTCILFNQNQVFESFGGAAEDKYTELAQAEEHMDWFFFKRFKMQLYDKKEISRDFMLEGENGCLMPAMIVFTESIKFLRTQIQEDIRSMKVSIKPEEINWVLTVPAIWSDPAKQFMREAANAVIYLYLPRVLDSYICHRSCHFLGGIPNSRLILVLEPEAASIYCKNLFVNRKISSGGRSYFDSFAAGTKYLILNAEGDTTDITVQEIKPDGSIKQIYMVNGGEWGGGKVNQAFEEFMLDIVGMETMDKFRNEDKAEYLSLCRRKIPGGKGYFFERFLKSNKFISWIGDKLRINSNIVKGIYSKTCRQITDKLDDIFQEPVVVDTEIILMVGDISGTQMLQEAIKSEYHNKLVIIPVEPGLAVLKGAVQFGFNSKIMNPRISRFTYGISTIKHSRPHTIPEIKIQIINDIMYCRERFGKHVERGQSIEVGKVADQRTYNHSKRDQRRTCLPINSSLAVDPEYVDETECAYLGDLKVDVSDIRGGCEREVVVGIGLEGTNVAVEAVVKFTGEKVDARFNFLR